MNAAQVTADMCLVAVHLSPQLFKKKLAFCFNILNSVLVKLTGISVDTRKSRNEELSFSEAAHCLF